MKSEELQEKILEELKEKDQSTTFLSYKINRNYYSTLRLLNELEAKKLIKKSVHHGRTYWEVL